MEYKNLQRAAEIAHDLPRLNRARSMLSKADSTVTVFGYEGDPSVADSVELPHIVIPNIINALNLEINRMREEVKKL